MYIIEDEYDSNDYQYSIKYSKKKTFTKSKIIIIISIILFLLIGLIIARKTLNYRNSYQYLEKQLINKAREYVNNNNFIFNQETYLLASEIGYDLNENCSLLSGVFVKDDSYQAYLVCSDYKTKLINNSKEYIDFNDLDIMIIDKNTKYVDGYKKNEENIEINVNGFVGTDSGVYNLKYIITQGSKIVDTLNRKVVIIDNDYIKSFFPTITLNGNSIDYLLINNQYNDKSVNVFDKNEIINNITTISDLNTKKVGEYSINYIATNSKGYTSIMQRKVYVIDNINIINANTIISPMSLTSGNVEITFSINSSKYQYTILPNDNKTIDTNFKYTVKENGIYKFYIYDDKNITTHSVNITNIDHSVPTGTCTASVYRNYTDILIDAYSKNNISTYSYAIDSEKTEISSNRYRSSNNNPKKVEVIVKDGIGNSSNIMCDIKVMDPTIGNNNVTYLNFFGSEYAVVNTRISVTNFEKAIKGVISQNVDSSIYGSSCLGFARYHTCKLVYLNDGERMSAEAAHYYRLGSCKQQDYFSSNKQEILGMVFDEILKGYPLVLMVNGSSGRHFVTVIGYRREIYTKEELSESDLLIIDAWDGKIESMDQAVDKNARHMYKEAGNYRIVKIVHD